MQNSIDHITKLLTIMPAGNTAFASGGLTCKLGVLCFYSSSVLVDSFVLRNPPERKALKRYRQPLPSDRANIN